MKNKQPQKSPLNGKFPKKASSMTGEKAPSMAEGKAPSYYLPHKILGIVGEIELKNKITAKNQNDWTTKIRIAGLLLILDFFARNGGKAPMSSVLSREYVSTCKRSKNPATIKQPLVLLEHLGLIEKTQKALKLLTGECRQGIDSTPLMANLKAFKRT